MKFRAEGAKASEMLAKNNGLKALLLFQDTISEASARGLYDALVNGHLVEMQKLCLM